MTEYPVSPEDIAAALAAKTVFDTGLLSENTLCVRAEGATRTVCEYRPAQKISLWLEGTDDPLRVPLPGLLMIRRTTGGRSPDYQVWAVAERPTSYDALLYHAPLPNVYPRGAICWGTVSQVDKEALASSNLAADWQQLLGTRFGSHSVSGKSKQHRNDVRQMYLELEARKARVYPRKDLVEAKTTLGHALKADD